MRNYAFEHGPDNNFRKRIRCFLSEYKKRLSTCVLCLFAALLVYTGLHAETPQNARGGVKTDSCEYISLYCDVSFWNPSAWSTEPGTITGDITQKTGIAVDVTVPQRDADRKLSLMLLNDELPDVISVTDQTVIRQLVTSGKVWKLDEFLETCCPDSHLLKEFPQDVKKELVRRDGAWYAYPSHLDSADARSIWKPSSAYYKDYVNYHYNNAIIWNKKLLKRLGIAEDELHTKEQALLAFKKAAKSGLLVSGKPVIPLLLDGSAYQETSLEFFLQTFGAQPLDEDGNYRDILFSPEAEEALRFLQEAMAQGYCPSSVFTVSNEKIKQYITGGRVLCFAGNISNTSFAGNEWISSGALLSSRGASPVLGKNMHANSGWISTFISKSCKSPQKTARWLDYMTSDEGRRLWHYGYEGRHYAYDSQGLIVRTEEQTRLEDRYTKTGIGTWWMFENTAWMRSIIRAPEKGSQDELEDRAAAAYGRDAQTVIYDNAPFDFKELAWMESGLEAKERALNEWKKEMILDVILAKDSGEFWQRYQLLLDGMKQRGQKETDSIKNRYFKENCRRLGIRAERINGGTGQK